MHRKSTVRNKVVWKEQKSDLSAGAAHRSKAEAEVAKDMRSQRDGCMMDSNLFPQSQGARIVRVHVGETVKGGRCFREYARA